MIGDRTARDALRDPDARDEHCARLSARAWYYLGTWLLLLLILWGNAVSMR